MARRGRYGRSATARAPPEGQGYLRWWLPSISRSTRRCFAQRATCRIPPWRIRHVARLNGVFRHPYSVRIPETPLAVLCSFFGPPSREKFLTSPPPMPSRVARSWNSGRSEATVSVPSDGPHDFRSCVGCAGSFGSWCSPRPHSGPDPHRACQRKPLSYF